MTETPRQRLARLMDERREALGLNWNQIAERSGLTKTGLTHVRFEERKMRAPTKRGIEHALRWEIGSVDRILDGGDPSETSEPQRVENPSEVETFLKTGKVNIDALDALYVGALLCIRCLTEGRALKAAKLRESVAVTVTRGEALCFYHLTH